VLDADTGYDEKCDVWSIGVILFMLLIGRPPFYGSTDSETLELVCKGEYKIEAKISDLAQDLISKMLIVDPKKRISVEEAY
jgi:calcium-dependent protein kinase